MVNRKRVVGMGLQRRLKLANRLVVFEVVEVVEALAGISVIACTGWDPRVSLGTEKAQLAAAVSRTAMSPMVIRVDG